MAPANFSMSYSRLRSCCRSACTSSSPAHAPSSPRSAPPTVDALLRQRLAFAVLVLSAGFIRRVFYAAPGHAQNAPPDVARHGEGDIRVERRRHAQGFIAQLKTLSPGTSHTPTMPLNFPQLAKILCAICDPRLLRGGASRQQQATISDVDHSCSRPLSVCWMALKLQAHDAPRAKRAGGQRVQHGAFPVQMVSPSSIKYTLCRSLGSVMAASASTVLSPCKWCRLRSRIHSTGWGR